MSEEEVQQLLVRLDERTERVEADVAQLRHVVCEGNGSSALTVQVARIDERVTAIEGERTEASLSRSSWLMVLAAAVGSGGAITALIDLLRS